MLAVLSPAKKLDFGLPTQTLPLSSPRLIRQTATLMKTIRTLTPADIQRLMKLSDALAQLNHERNMHFAAGAKPRGSKQAALAFAGDTYQGLSAWQFDEADFTFAQQHVAILSGLYGVLRPLDAIQPYRLEMGTRISTERGNNLYEFWGARIARALDTQVREHTHRVVVNLASSEYFGAVDRKALQSRVITPCFQELRNGERKVIGLFAKRARGAMARYLVQNRITDPAALREFAEDGYRLDLKASDPDRWVFLRH